MKLSKYIVVLVVLFAITTETFAREKINLNFRNLNIYDFVKITSKIIDKNILITVPIKGKVDFIYNKDIYKDEIFGLLVFALESNGFTIVENKGILRIVKLADAVRYNTPVYNNAQNLKVDNMVTEVFNIENVNVDYLNTKIKHFASKSAKLVTDKESNVLIITDFLDNINTIKNVVAIITKDSKKNIETINLKNLQASTIINDLKAVAKTVFNEKVIKEKVEVLLNKDTNSIMFVGKDENVEYMKKYLLNMDKKGSLVEKVVDVITLKNAEATVIEKTINSIIGNKKYKDQNKKPFASVDAETNSIILIGPKEELKYFKQLISKLDVDRQQVYVQARIIEVSETKTNNVGLQYGFEGFKRGGTGLMTFSSALNSSGTVTPIGLDALTGYGLDIKSLKSGLSLGASINLLRQNKALDIVSEPSILCINNKESSIYVGETRSIQTGTTVGTTTTTNFKREDIGLKLTVKPRISNSNKVTLEIQTTLEDIKETTTTNGSPDTNKKEVLTTAIVNNGESVIIGGLIKNKVENTEDKVPFFGDIPILGALFRNNHDINDKINLVIIVTPYIIPKSRDLTFVRDQLSQLKMLEDKYTKDLEVNLAQMKLQEKKNRLVREQSKMMLNEANDELLEQASDFAEDKKEYEDEKLEKLNDTRTENERLHDERVKEILGL